MPTTIQMPRRWRWRWGGVGWGEPKRSGTLTYNQDSGARCESGFYAFYHCEAANAVVTPLSWPATGLEVSKYTRKLSFCHASRVAGGGCRFQLRFVPSGNLLNSSGICYIAEKTATTTAEADVVRENVTPLPVLRTPEHNSKKTKSIPIWEYKEREE